jgi:hypothetical protein
MKSLHALAVTATLGLAVLAATGTGSSASPVVSRAGQTIGSQNLVEVAGRWDHHRYDGRRCLYGRCRGSYGGHYAYGGYYGYRRHHYPYGGYYYGTPWMTFPFMFGGGFADRYYDDYDDYYDYGNNHGSAHVEWCLNRYRSYRPRTDTWTSYSGRVRRCISPYS